MSWGRGGDPESQCLEPAGSPAGLRGTGTGCPWGLFLGGQSVLVLAVVAAEERTLLEQAEWVTTKLPESSWQVGSQRGGARKWGAGRPTWGRSPPGDPPSWRRGSGCNLRPPPQEPSAGTRRCPEEGERSEGAPRQAPPRGRPASHLLHHPDDACDERVRVLVLLGAGVQVHASLLEHHLWGRGR